VRVLLPRAALADPHRDEDARHRDHDQRLDDRPCNTAVSY
jgi:hypothetical protein